MHTLFLFILSLFIYFISFQELLSIFLLALSFPSAVKFIIIVIIISLLFFVMIISSWNCRISIRENIEKEDRSCFHKRGIIVV
jgi:uncharacterized membrane protein